MKRVVTGVDDSGKSILVDHGQPPVSRQYVHTPGFADVLVWSTDPIPQPATETAGESLKNWLPEPGGTVAMFITIPPASVFAGPSFDPAAAAAENQDMTPGLAETFEPDDPGMHTTPTVDYIVVVEGELELELDDGVATTVSVGDVVVQNATRHRWRNLTDKPATFFGVLMGTESAK